MLINERQLPGDRRQMEEVGIARPCEAIRWPTGAMRGWGFGSESSIQIRLPISASRSRRPRSLRETALIALNLPLTGLEKRR